MARRLWILLACLALLGTWGCRPAVQEEKAQDESPAADASGDATYQEVMEATQKAYMETESFDEKLAIARAFLERFPQSEDLTDVVALVGNDALEAARPEEAFELVEWALGRAEDAETRFRVRMQLADFYGKTGKKDELRALAAELGKGRELRYRDLYAIVEAATAAEDWDLVVDKSEASLAYASPAHYKEDSPEMSDAEAEKYGTRRLAYSHAAKGWAQFNLGRVDEAFGSFRRAKESTDYNVLGVDATPLQRYWGQALLAQGEAEEAMALLATEALFGGDDSSLEAYRKAYASCHDGEEGLEEHLWAKRQEHAKPIPDFTLPNYDDENVSLSGFQGDVVLLAFWFPT